MICLRGFSCTTTTVKLPPVREGRGREHPERTISNAPFPLWHLRIVRPQRDFKLGTQVKNNWPKGKGPHFSPLQLMEKPCDRKNGLRLHSELYYLSEIFHNEKQ